MFLARWKILRKLDDLDEFLRTTVGLYETASSARLQLTTLFVAGRPQYELSKSARYLLLSADDLRDLRALIDNNLPRKSTGDTNA